MLHGVPSWQAMSRGIVLQTQDDAPPGLLGEWAARRGLELHTVRADREEFPEPRDYAFVVALGSGATARGEGPPWVQTTIEWLRAADAAALPVLGICFGAQALAAALGGSVHRLDKPEVGWIMVDSRDPDRLPAGPWMAWHEDGFTLPPLAYELASNAFGVQAFCHGRHLAVQFHPRSRPRLSPTGRRTTMATSRARAPAARISRCPRERLPRPRFSSTASRPARR
jgi:GMP synthase-like glutamine amidotransferase